MFFIWHRTNLILLTPSFSFGFFGHFRNLKNLVKTAYYLLNFWKMFHFFNEKNQIFEKKFSSRAKV